MLTPMRSFTLPTGFWLSSLATTSATQPSVTLLSRTRGVWPISSVTSFAILMSVVLQSDRAPSDRAHTIARELARGFQALIASGNTTNSGAGRDLVLNLDVRDAGSGTR